MRTLRQSLCATVAFLCLNLAVAAPMAAANGNGNGNGHEGVPEVSATPELDSLALFGTGAAAMVGYALMRLRAARRDKNEGD